MDANSIDLGDAQSANCHGHHDHYFPAPQLTTMTIARSSSLSTNGLSAMRPPMMTRTTSTGANPMMRVTLPKELGDDPLASPIGAKPLPAFFPEPLVQEKQPEPEPTTSTSSGFANVFTRRRQSSIEKKPPMAPMLRRTTSAPIKNHHPSLLSKMAPMLKRVVSGTKSVPEDDEEDDYGDAESRESLLMLMQVPEIQRVSLVPLMMASHYDY